MHYLSHTQSRVPIISTPVIKPDVENAAIE